MSAPSAADAAGGPPTRPVGLGGLPVVTPQQAQAAQVQQQRMQEQFQLRVAIADNLRRIRHTIIVMSGKGGVGKSTVAVNLAAAFAAEGATVGLLDLDLTNPNVPIMLDLERAKPGGSSGRIVPVEVKAPTGGALRVMSTEFFLVGRDSPIIWRGPIKMNMIHQLLGNVEWGDLDFLVVDLPPGTSDEPLSIAQLLKDADGVVLVTTPQSVSVLDVGKSVQFVRTMDLNVIGVVENMATFVCPHCGVPTDVFGRGGGEEIAKKYGVPLLGRIPLEPSVVASAEQGVPVVWREGDGPAQRAFRDTVAEVRRNLRRPA